MSKEGSEPTKTYTLQEAVMELKEGKTIERAILVRLLAVLMLQDGQMAASDGCDGDQVKQMLQSLGELEMQELVRGYLCSIPDQNMAELMKALAEETAAVT